jgi:hypothetical protein
MTTRQPASEPHITWSDLERWAAEGLIAPEQLDAIRNRVTGSPSAQPETGSAAALPAVPAAVAREHPAGLNLVTVAYYFGAFIILLAGTIFIGLQWEELGRAGQLAASGGAVAGLWLIGAELRRRGYRRGGDLLIFAGTGIAPLAVYTVLRMLDLWPDSADAASYQAFYRTIDAAWLMLEIASILITLGVIWLTGFPLLTLLLGFWGWYLSMDVTELLTGHDDFAWGPAEWWVGTAVGLVMIAIGVWQQRRRGGQAWSRWFYLFGHVTLLGNLAALALGDDTLPGVLFLAVYVGCVVASVWLQSRVFLVFGALGIYAYIAKLAFDVFDRSLGFALALGAIGLLIVLATVGYQRYAEPWLARRLVGARAAPPATADEPARPAVSTPGSR